MGTVLFVICRILLLVSQNVPGTQPPSSPLKMLSADKSDVNMAAVICDLLFIWALF